MSYKIVYSPWWASNGCDCCEPTEMEGWEVEGLPNFDSGHLDITYQSVEEALFAIVAHEKIKVEIVYEGA